MSFKALLIVFALLKCATSSSLDTCSNRGFFPKDLDANGIYYIYSTQTIQNYSGQNSCVWFTTCPEEYNVKLVCPLVDLPASPNCSRDHLLIQVGKDVLPVRKCGNETIVSVSIARQLSVVLRSPPDSTGGRFWCQLSCQKQDLDDVEYI